MQALMGFVRLFGQISKEDVGIAGGKGASLGEMTQAGIPVPTGFVVVAAAFDRFLEETDLLQEVKAQLAKVDYENVASVERASLVLRDLIHKAAMPKDIEGEIVAAHKALGVEFVAVRSSATAEDSSVASWAGELETYLNTTNESLLQNVKRCWASLFTPRAIVYRSAKGMNDTHVSVAIVVQAMVQSEVSGITFTVHPVTEDRNQMIIEAAWGLGELIVGGMVTPDAYVVDKRDGTTIDVNVATQEEMLIRSAQGNVKSSVPPEQQSAQKLSSIQITQLADLCKRIEQHYGFPCDVEWAMENERFYIVQSRPITTLQS